MGDTDSNETESGSESEPATSSSDAGEWDRPSWVQTGPSYNSREPGGERRFDR